MQLVVDANVLFSAMIKSGETRRILLLSEHDLYAPEFMIEEFKKHLPFDHPTRIIKRFLSDFATNKKQTRWSIIGHRYPEWTDADNISLIRVYLKEEKEHFKTININTRNFLKNNKMPINNPTVQDSLLYLDYIFNQNNILEGSFNDISYIHPKLNFSTQEKIDLMKSLPLICYFVPWLLGHHRLAMKNSHFSPKKNPNSIDIAHSFYMGACDIFVTDDERLHSLLDDLNKFKYFKYYKQVRIIDTNQLISSL